MICCLCRPLLPSNSIARVGFMQGYEFGRCMIKVRLAVLEDAVQLLDLVRVFPTPTPIGVDAFSTMFQQKLNDSYSFVAVAERGEVLVGYISGHRHSAFYAAGDTAWVDEILVLDVERRSGVGRMLMVEFEQWASEADCRLTALATAGATDFYRAIGYSTKAGYFKKYLGNG